jgi:hypothetical protein
MTVGAEITTEVRRGVVRSLRHGGACLVSSSVANRSNGRFVVQMLLNGSRPYRKGINGYRTPANCLEADSDWMQESMPRPDVGVGRPQRSETGPVAAR